MHKATPEQAAHIIVKLQQYINSIEEEMYCCVSSHTSSYIAMLQGDAAYNLMCLKNFEKHNDLRLLRNEIYEQDTAPREAATHAIVDRELGLTYELFNSL